MSFPAHGQTHAPSWAPTELDDETVEAEQRREDGARLRHYRSESAAAATPISYRWTVAGWVSILIVGSLVDVTLILPVFDRVLRSSRYVSIGFSVALALTAAVLAYAAGKAAWAAHGSRTERAWAIALAGAWAAIGICLFTYRLVASGSHSSQLNEPLMAVAMVFVYAAVGLGAAHAGWVLNNPALKAYLAAMRLLPAATTGLQQAEAEAGAALVAVATTTYQLLQVDAEHHDAMRNTHDVADELRALARELIAEHLGDPAATGVVRRPFTSEVADPSGRSGFDAPA